MGFKEKLVELANQDPNGVLGIKLSTGEFVLGSLGLNALSGNAETLVNPIACGFAGGDKIGFGPWLPVGEVQVDLDILEKSVIAVVVVAQNLSDEYARMTGLKKILAPNLNKKILV